MVPANDLDRCRVYKHDWRCNAPVTWEGPNEWEVRFLTCPLQRDRRLFGYLALLKMVTVSFAHHKDIWPFIIRTNYTNQSIKIVPEWPVGARFWIKNSAILVVEITDM